MRIRLINPSTNQTAGTYFSIQEALQILGVSLYKLKKAYKVERIHETGYWDNVDKDYLRAVAVKRYGRKY